MRVKPQQIESKLSNYQLKLIIESLRELGVNVVLALLLTFIFESGASTRQVVISCLFILIAWYTLFIISQRINHD